MKLATRVLLLCVGVPLVGPVAADETLALASEGRALATVRLASGALPAEATAARELVDYLTRVTGAPFEIVEEGTVSETGPTIEIGPTRYVRSVDPDVSRLGPEAWVIRADGERLCLYGGRPRGTLYAVYHFLEDRVGVRWWNPYEEHVPREPELSVRPGVRRGEPTFVYRDIHGVDGREFLARNRVNGHFTRLTSKHGGAESYGPPSQAHTFALYVPPDEYFESHPEYFSEVAGLRHGGQAQLCLTNARLLRLVTRKLEGYIEQSRERARRTGEPAPRLFNVSPNDWGNPCTCGPCSALAARYGGQAGPLIAFVNALAAAIEERYPDVLIDTLAYLYTRNPPLLRTADNVSVRFSGLQVRDFARPVAHPANAAYLAALKGWREQTTHLRVWDYVVVFGKQGEMPLPNLAHLAADLALYRRLGVEGLFVQHGSAISADMRDLKVWSVAKLLEDPGRPYGRLIRDFTNGYYGPAAGSIRRYLRLREKAARRRPSRIAYQAPLEDYAYLDRDFLVRAQRTFDRASRQVAGDALLARRVDHARLSLDRATLALWSELQAGSGPPFDRRAVVERYRRTWYTQIGLRTPEPLRAAARAAVDIEIEGWGSRGTAEGG